jgi:uncharacterized damage-inducible protein DinB
MLDYFKKLFAFDKWATSRSLEFLSAYPNQKALTAISHVLLAQKIWLLRLHNEDSSSVPTYEDRSIESCSAMAGEIQNGYLDFLNGIQETDLGRLISYKNTKGVEFQTSIRDILMHVAFHSVYHRGQAASFVRDDGGAPLNTDYITFTRL